MTKFLSKLFPEKTPDQQLVAEIRKRTEELRLLCQEANKRNITVWLKEYNGGRPNLLYGKYLQFDEARRNNVEKF